MTSIEFFVRGDPKGQPRPRAFAFHGKARVFDPGTAEGWKSCVAIAANPHIPKVPIEGPLKVSLVFWFARPQAHYLKGKIREKFSFARYTKKPDADNLAKAVLDALTTLGMWKDDAQVDVLTVTKLWSFQTEDAGVRVRIVTDEEGL